MGPGAEVGGKWQPTAFQQQWNIQGTCRLGKRKCVQGKGEFQCGQSVKYTDKGAKDERKDWTGSR